MKERRLAAALLLLLACSGEVDTPDQVFVLSAVNGQMPALIDVSANPAWPFVMLVADSIVLGADGTYREKAVTTLWGEGGAEGTLFSTVVTGTYRPSGERVTFSPEELTVGYTVATGNGGRMPGEGLVLDQRTDVDRLSAGADLAEFRAIELD